MTFPRLFMIASIIAFQ